MDKNYYMKIALKEAQMAYECDEVPVGAVIVYNDAIIAQGHNENRSMNMASRHAEMIAIERASEYFSNERLIDCELFVTKEPCAMCAGAIVHSRIKKVIIGTHDERYGCCGTVLSICGNEIFNHVPAIEFGILQEECSQILKKFFKSKRNML